MKPPTSYPFPALLQDFPANLKPNPSNASMVRIAQPFSEVLEELPVLYPQHFSMQDISQLGQYLSTGSKDKVAQSHNSFAAL